MSMGTGLGSGSHDLGLKSHDVEIKGYDKLTAAKAEDSTDGIVDNGFRLPSFNPSSSATKDGHVPAPAPARDTAGSHGDSESSDWSSSDEEGPKRGEGKGGGLEEEMKPSTHSTLIAEWEWRAMNQDTTTARWEGGMALWEGVWCHCGKGVWHCRGGAF